MGIKYPPDEIKHPMCCVFIQARHGGYKPQALRSEPLDRAAEDWVAGTSKVE